VLPVGYDLPASREKRYPVIYLLHGLFGHYDNWTSKTRLTDYTSTYDVIIVTPEGNNGWYTDSQSAPKEQYESYIVKELIPDVDRRFRTIGDRSGRAIAGLSMGGYGAIKFGVKYPAMFRFAGSMSGAMNAASWTREELAGFPSIWNSLQQMFGDDRSQTRLSNDLPGRIRDLSNQEIAALPFIYLDCGTEDPLFPSNRSFAELLVSRKIAHEYRQRPGGHGWSYWDTQVQEVLKLAMKTMQK
jgi:S-formylglutathione hydrolase FrmB